ncbi:MAG: phytoene desaturase [Saprospirales bacterium]|nr:MAG: phytoene desaturase [Saprospirales bacterium]
MKKVAVIGSGVAGVAIAARLAARGYNVTVFEKNLWPGGKLSEVKVGDFRFDAGPSLFTMPQWVDEIFTVAGENPREHFNYHRLPVVCKYFWQNGKTLDIRQDMGATAAEMSATFGESPDALTKYLSKSSKKYRLAGEIFLQQPLNRFKTWLNWKTVRALKYLPHYDLFKSLHSCNDSHFRSPELIQLFDRYATYNGSDPYRASGMFSMIPHIEMNEGAWAPEGGMIEIVKSLYHLGLRCAVSYRFGSEVSEIKLEGKKVKGVIYNGNKFQEADLVVSNMDINLTYDKLLPGLKPPAKLKYEERSSSGFIFYWGMNRTFPDLDVHNILFSSDYRSEFESIRKGEFSNDPTIYINISSKYHPPDAPNGMENWFVMINGPNDSGQDWEKIKKQLKKIICKRVEKITGVNIEACIVEEEVLDPLKLAKRTLSADGALYGSSSNSMWSAFLRQANQHSSIKNLYFCGGSVHPGGGIPLCLSSARIVDQMINDEL